MDDLISKSALIEELQKRIGGDLDIEDVEYLEKVVNSIPTVDEKEIIRKAFERVVERLEKKAKEYTNDDLTYCIPYFGIEEAIEIVKEECGINE